MSFACSSPAGGMLFGVSGLLLLLLFPQTAPSTGYSICKYTNWTGIPGSICIKKFNQHLHSYLSGAQFYNLTRFRMGLGAWKIKVNSIHLYHIKRNQRYCSFCAGNHNSNVVNDEEHVTFHCPEYDICHQEYPELFWGTNMNMCWGTGWGVPCPCLGLA